MKHSTRRPTVESVTAIALLLLVAACGGKQTVAVKSAEAFRDAQQKGVSAGGDSHGGHSAGSAAGTTTDSAGDHATMTGMDHSTMAGNSQGGMTGMDHSKMQQGQPMAGMDHSKMQQGQQPMAGMDHSKMQQGQQPMAGMDHSKMQRGQQPMAGMNHGSTPGMEHGAETVESVVMSAPTTSGEMQGISPGATLRLDDFDKPVAISVSEAMKSTQGGNQGNTAAPTIDHSQHGQPVPSAKPATQSRTQSRVMTAPKTTPVAATIYACPMHPEVTSDKPGTCPKCGMALVKK